MENETAKDTGYFSFVRNHFAYYSLGALLKNGRTRKNIHERFVMFQDNQQFMSHTFFLETNANTWHSAMVNRFRKFACWIFFTRITPNQVRRIPEVQNRDIIGLTKSSYVLKNLNKKSYITNNNMLENKGVCWVC